MNSCGWGFASPLKRPFQTLVFSKLSRFRLALFACKRRRARTSFCWTPTCRLRGGGGGGARSALEAIRLACPGLPVVIISGAANHKFVNRCFALGACGFVAKSFGSAQVVACVQTVLAGATYRPDVSDGGVSSLRESLTRREEEIALFCAAGLRNKEIGQRLGISDNTVRVHLVKIFKRFDLTRRADIKGLVNRMGLREANSA